MSTPTERRAALLRKLLTSTSPLYASAASDALDRMDFEAIERRVLLHAPLETTLLHDARSESLMMDAYRTLLERRGWRHDPQLREAFAAGWRARKAVDFALMYSNTERRES